jgi:beta-barrel assembly-enhancing protease
LVGFVDSGRIRAEDNSMPVPHQNSKALLGGFYLFADGCRSRFSLFRITLIALLILQLVFPVSLVAGALSQKEQDTKKIGSGLNFFSVKQEISLGRSYSENLNRQLDLVDDPFIAQYIGQLGQKLVQMSERRDIEYHFYVVNTREVNAFALPGGFIYVNRGLIETADSEDELAGVLAHEIGHVAGKHGLRQLSKKLLLAGVTVGAGMAVGMKSAKWGEVVQAAGGIGVFFAALKFSRDDEREADWLALQTLNRAGMDPRGMISFFQKLDAMSKERGVKMPAFLNTHPLPAERVRNMEAQLLQLEKLPRVPIQYASAFDTCRTRLGSIPLPPPAREKTLSSALAALDSPEQYQQETPVQRRPRGKVAKRISLPGETSWMDTGVDIYEGDRVLIRAGGKVFWKRGSEESCDPSGAPNTGKGFWKPISRANTGALIGKLAENSYDYFLVGSSHRFTAEAAGRLFLGINDDNAADNRGSFEVEVSVER